MNHGRAGLLDGYVPVELDHRACLPAARRVTHEEVTASGHQWE